MPRELFVKILEQLQDMNYGGRVSYHFYNEPTLSPNLDTFVKLTKEYLPTTRTELFSNGTLLNKARVEALAEDGIDKFTITKHFQAEIPELENDLAELTPSAAEKVRMRGYKELDLTNRGGSLSLRNPLHKPPLSLPCLIPHCAMVITVKGNVIPCYEDFYQKHVMGNVQTQSLFEIWNSEKYVNFRRRLRQGDRKSFDVCKDCNNSWVIN